MRLQVWLTGLAGVVALSSAVCLRDASPLQAQIPAARSIKCEQNTIYLIDERVLAFEKPGVIAFIKPEEGAVVRKGEVIAGLKDEVARATLAKEQEKARNDVQVRFAKKSSEVADAELRISESANERLPGTVPEVELQKLRLAAQKGLLQIEQAEFEQKIAALTVAENQAVLETHQLVAPFDGTVARIHQREGAAARQGDPIIEIISTDRVKIEGYVSTSQSYLIRPGDHVEARLVDQQIPRGAQPISGIVKFVDPRVSPVIGKVKVTAEVQNSEGLLKAGLGVEMSIQPGTAVLSPQAARAARQLR